MADHDSERLARWWGMRRLPAALATLNRGALCMEYQLSAQAAHKCSRSGTKNLGTKISYQEIPARTHLYSWGGYSNPQKCFEEHLEINYLHVF